MKNQKEAKIQKRRTALSKFISKIVMEFTMSFSVLSVIIIISGCGGNDSISTSEVEEMTPEVEQEETTPEVESIPEVVEEEPDLEVVLEPGLKTTTTISANVLKRFAKSINKSVYEIDDLTELIIGSADIFMYDFDEVNDRWDSECGRNDSVDTYDNDEEAVLLVDALKFDPSEEIKDLDSDNLPDTVDIIYFDNRWHTVKIDDQYYGDHDREIDHAFFNDRQPQMDGISFEAVDVVFINRDIFPLSLTVVTNNDDSLTYSVDLSDDQKDVLDKIFEQVRWVEEVAIIIPFKGIDFPKTKLITVTVDLDSLIESMTDTTIEYSADKNSSPVSYSIKVSRVTDNPFE